MFLLDNQVVREDWKKAKGIVTDALKKHGAKVVCARRWDERRLAYPIHRRRRATFCIAYYEMGNAGIGPLRRDLELNENVLRYLILAKESVPAGELDLAAAEDAAGFAVPAPPPDDAPDAPVARRREDGAEGEAETPETQAPEPEGDEAAAARTPEKEA
jgi:small subunit ribosomal protein S6